jgi:hypothetical protein
MEKMRLLEQSKGQLLAEIAELEKELNKKKLDLKKARAKLVTYRSRIQKMKVIISYQRSRILQLYNTQPLGGK